MGGSRAGTAVLLAVTALLAAPAPVASAGTRAPGAAAPPAASPGGTPTSEVEPDAGQVRAALQQAQQLRSVATQGARDVTRARAAVTASSADAALALEAYAQAAEVRDTAAAEATRAEQALAGTRQDVEEQQSALARWARDAYMDGGAAGSSPTLSALLGGGTTDAAASAGTWLERAGADRLRVLDSLSRSLATRDAAATAARHASDVAEAAAAQASAARSARDAVLARHRGRLAELEGLLAASADAADRADAVAGRLARAWAGGGSGGAATSAGLAPPVAGPGGAECPGDDVSGYPNGELPTSALCPLPGAPGELLRADAAAAFARLSADYRASTGRLLCVTDGYRSYAEQVRARAEHGRWAAVPGRSRHGWGVAVDLCGGVEDFDSPAHAWLAVNGPLYGWYHPAWAQRGGSLPEPWHWEFAGQAG